MMYMLRRATVQAFLDNYANHVDTAGLPFSRRSCEVQPRVSWQHRNGGYLLLELLRDLQQHELHLAREQESCHTA